MCVFYLGRKSADYVQFSMKIIDYTGWKRTKLHNLIH